jgi:hypothetical protein
MRKAKARGNLVFALEPVGGLPVHFVTVDGPCISLIRVRRLKYPGYTVAEIGHSCKNDIAALRSITVTAEIVRELRVRGPDRRWYRYLVLPASVEVLEDEDRTDNRDKPETRLRPGVPAVPDNRACGADTGNRSGSLPVGTAGWGTP